MTTADSASLLERFEQQQIPALDFHHHDHIQVAFEMLDAYDFVDACARYASTIKAMAAGVGVPEKFNATITFAFMSVIAERKAQMNGADLVSFLAANQDLLDKNVLDRWYSEARLTSPAARAHFLLPDKSPRH